MLHRSIKGILIVFVLMMNFGCSEMNCWTWEKWLIELSLQAGFSSNEADALEDLKKFEVVNIERFQPDEKLTYLMVQFTAESLFVSLEELEDVFFTNKNQILNIEQAQAALSMLVKQLNDFGTAAKQEILFQQEPVVLDVIEYNGRWLKVKERQNEGQIVQLGAKFLKVAQVNEDWILVEEVNYDEVEELNLEGRVSLDPLSSAIIVQQEIVEFKELPGAGLPAARLSKSFNIQGFTVRISASSDSIHIYASKKTESGLPVFVQFDINEINCSFRWKSKKNQVEASALKVSYETSLTSGLRSADYEDRVVDFSKVDSEHLLSSLKDAFVKQKDCLEESIELAEIQLPFPEMPCCTLNMKIMLHLYAGGKAEIGFESAHEAGFEMINGHIRKIGSTEKQAHLALRASAKATTKLQFGLRVFTKECMDVAVEAGIQANAQTRVLTADQKQQELDVPYELAELAAEQNEQMLVCADLDASWIVNILLNSKNTVLGAMGASKTFELVNSSNGSLFGKPVHLENFQRVDKCTRAFQTDSPLQITINSDRIELKHYLLILEAGESELIQISALPDALQKSDVVYASLDESIASVSSKGQIKAIESGETIVTVSSKDGEYESQCSVFVR